MNAKGDLTLGWTKFSSLTRGPGTKQYTQGFGRGLGLDAIVCLGGKLRALPRAGDERDLEDCSAAKKDSRSCTCEAS